MGGDWSAEADTEHDSGNPLITSCGHPTRAYNLKGQASPFQSDHPAQPQGNSSTSQSDPPATLFKLMFNQQHVWDEMPISCFMCELQENWSIKIGALKQNIAWTSHASGSARNSCFEAALQLHWGKHKHANMLTMANVFMFTKAKCANMLTLTK